MIRSTVRFVNTNTEFTSRVAVMTDIMMALMAVAIESKIKTSGKVPLLPKSTKYAQRGALRASIRHTKLMVGRYAVTAGTGSPAAAYAAAQEAGVTRGHVMRHYSTPGTGPHWFEDAIDEIKGRAPEYANAAQRAAGIGGI